MLLALVSLTIRLKLTPSRNAAAPILAVASSVDARTFSAAMRQLVTLPMLETLRRRLRALVKLIEYKKRILVYSDFEDRSGTAAHVTVNGLSIGTDMDAFRRKARVFLRPHENHIAVLKVRRNEPLTPTDLEELFRRIPRQ
jgi:type I restriction enzyme, R subunit